jgi:hypothetical protein
MGDVTYDKGITALLVIDPSCRTTPPPLSRQRNSSPLFLLSESAKPGAAAGRQRPRDVAYWHKADMAVVLNDGIADISRPSRPVVAVGVACW